MKRPPTAAVPAPDSELVPARRTQVLEDEIPSSGSLLDRYVVVDGREDDPILGQFRVVDVGLGGGFHSVGDFVHFKRSLFVGVDEGLVPCYYYDVGGHRSYSEPWDDGGGLEVMWKREDLILLNF